MLHIYIDFTLNNPQKSHTAFRKHVGFPQKAAWIMFLGQTELLWELHFPLCLLRARRRHVVLWVYVRSDLTSSAAQRLEPRSDSLHLALRFWNLINGRRVKGWRPRPDPAENGACVKRFTPWAGEEGETRGSNCMGGTGTPTSLDHPEFPYFPLPGGPSPGQAWEQTGN